jgi:hypothetical protein
MGRNQRKGATFEQGCADYATKRTGDEVIRKRLHGAKDEGDLYGLRCRGKRVTVECKDCAKMELGKWVDEAETERGNDSGEYGVVIHHRKGKGVKSFGENYVTMTYDTFLAICVGGRDLLEDI